MPDGSRFITLDFRTSDLAGNPASFLLELNQQQCILTHAAAHLSRTTVQIGELANQCSQFIGGRSHT